MWTDGQTLMTKLTGAFLQISIAIVPKISMKGSFFFTADQLAANRISCDVGSPEFTVEGRQQEIGL
jgi:hypothetical protein